jgi:tricarballylate dehydrogenase
MEIANEPFDLIVVGCGAAGLSAAVSYLGTANEHRHPARTIVLESASEPERGGASRWTTSRFRVGQGRTFDPTWVDNMQRISGGLSDAAYCRTMESEIPNTLDFLEEHGVELQEIRMPVAAGSTHETSPKGGGRAIVEALATALLDAGGQILYETEALRLSVSADGRVNGVAVRGADGRLRTLESRAVVLASGGFEGNPEMLTQYIGANACDLKLLAPGLASNRGNGIRMAMEVGAATAGQFDMIHAELVDRRTTRPDAANYCHPYGIVVNGDAQRFFDEGSGTFEQTFELIAFEVWRNQKQTAFFIADQTIVAYPGVLALIDTDMPPIEAATLEKLAEKLAIDPEKLIETVQTFNAAVGPEPFDPNRRDGKSTRGIFPPKSNWAYPLDKPPYLAYPLTSAICFTYGGIRTDTSARVVTASGMPIPNLYAAGEIVGLFYHEYPAGTSVLKALTFGRIAGVHAAQAALAFA